MTGSSATSSLIHFNGASNFPPSNFCSKARVEGPFYGAKVKKFRLPSTALLLSLESDLLKQKMLKFGTEIIELQNFKPALVDDIAVGHVKAYVAGLEKDGSYPGTDKIDELSHRDSGGTTLNLPPPGGSEDIAMGLCLMKSLYQVLKGSGQILFLFMPATHYILAPNIKQLVKDLCGGRCIFFLEVGYNLDYLSNLVADYFHAVLGEKSLASEFDNPAILHKEPSTKVKQAIQRNKHILSLSRCLGIISLSRSSFASDLVGHLKHQRIFP